MIVLRILTWPWRSLDAWAARKAAAIKRQRAIDEAERIIMGMRPRH